MNKVIIEGRITHDLELKQTQSGKNVITFTVAVKRQGAEQDDFLRCIAFNKSAEFIKSYFCKGKPILIEGNLKSGSYKRQDGSTQFTTDIWVEKVEFSLGDSGNGNGNRTAPGQNTQPQQQYNNPPQQYGNNQQYGNPPPQYNNAAPPMNGYQQNAPQPQGAYYEEVISDAVLPF